MRAGALRYKLSLLRPERTTDKSGAEVVRYIVSATVWAERVRATGNRSEEAGEHFPAFSVQYNIRSAHQIAEYWQVKEPGGYLYNVVAIIPNKERGFNTLVCERVNE